ncbi:hypothetical protein PHLGIDRAFT_463789 [Phlebiopsis gigantea 11061_1 CR5-6]|uniref:Uncharacterized protein n=1 Tax=Phlebiopsis gigantea (strain 11061_1 CR5-6) TaxID=745531 RepID=A0A0C3PJJ4_PHLG1|nr:hypothetical protein PHLGIDRAFT_463789 [Phlebiopsis gigantea 11061_1 CR5-6]
MRLQLQWSLCSQASWVATLRVGHHDFSLKLYNKHTAQRYAIQTGRSIVERQGAITDQRGPLQGSTPDTLTDGTVVFPYTLKALPRHRDLSEGEQR